MVPVSWAIRIEMKTLFHTVYWEKRNKAYYFSLHFYLLFVWIKMHDDNICNVVKFEKKSFVYIVSNFQNFKHLLK